MLKVLVLSIGVPIMAQAEQVTVAVASNFLTTAQALVQTFERETDHKVTLVNGSTGNLYAQIKNGAPYDVFLSADRERIELLEQSGLLAPKYRKIYALGVLIMVANDPALLKLDRAGGVDIKASLSGDIEKFAMADPRLAPYGRATLEVLKSINATDALQSKAVIGTNISQAAVFVRTGNAQIGFLAKTQRFDFGPDAVWVEAPQDYYQPIEQESGLLKHSMDNAGAVAFFQYLTTPAAQETIVAAGFRRIK